MSTQETSGYLTAISDTASKNSPSAALLMDTYKKNKLLHYRGLVNDRNVLPSAHSCILERIIGNSLGCFPCYQFDALDHALNDFVLNSAILSFGIFSNN